MKEINHGGDIYSQKIDLDFSVSINPLGMPREVREAALEGVRLSEHYPDLICRRLVRSLAEKYQLLGASILVGSGAVELIDAFCRTVHPMTVMTDAPTFTEYERASSCAWTPDPDQADLVCLCNPNNPTGSLRKKEELLRITRNCLRGGTFVLVDESFLPFTGEGEENSMLRETEHFPNLIVVRSFTKMYAMPGLRLGWAAVGNTHIKEKMEEMQPPWSVSIPAQMAGEAALRLHGFEEMTRSYVRRERALLTGSLRELSYVGSIFPSEANYFLIKGPAGLDAALAKQRILIRNCKDMRGLSREYFRISVKKREENLLLINELNKIENIYKQDN